MTSYIGLNPAFVYFTTTTNYIYVSVTVMCAISKNESVLFIILQELLHYM